MFPGDTDTADSGRGGGGAHFEQQGSSSFQYLLFRQSGLQNPCSLLHKEKEVLGVGAHVT